jgi:hypothetical protein
MKIGPNACKTKNIGFVTIRVTFFKKNVECSILPWFGQTSNTPLELWSLIDLSLSRGNIEHFQSLKKYQHRSKAIWA